MANGSERVDGSVSLEIRVVNYREKFGSNLGIVPAVSAVASSTCISATCSMSVSSSYAQSFTRWQGKFAGWWEKFAKRREKRFPVLKVKRPEIAALAPPVPSARPLSFKLLPD